MLKQNDEARYMSFGVRFWGLLTVIFFTFGLLCFILFSQASKNKDANEVYIAKLEQQLTESNEKYAKSMAAASNELYGQGRRKDALYVLKDVLVMDGADSLMPYSPEVRFALTQALGVYASGTAYVPLCEMKMDKGVRELSLSEEQTRLLIRDSFDEYLLYDTDSVEEITQITDVEQGSDPFWIGENLYYLDVDKDIAVCTSDGEKLLVEEGSFDYLGYLADRNLYAYAHREVVVVSPHDGKVLKRFVTPELNSLMEVADIYLTTESIFIVAYTAADSLLTEYMPDGTFVARHTLSDMDPGMHLAAGERFYYLTPYEQASRQLICYDVVTQETVWSTVFSLSDVKTMMLSADQSHIIAANDNQLMVFDADGSCVYEKNYMNEILAVECRQRSNSVRVILSDNTYELISVSDWTETTSSFFDKQPQTEADAIAVCGDCVFVHFREGGDLFQYGISRNLSAEYVEDTQEGIVNRRGTLQMVCRDSGKEREYTLYDFETGEIKVEMAGEYRSFAFVEDGSEYFILYGSTLDVCSVEDGTVAYSFENASMPLFSSDYDAVYLPGMENGVYNLLTGEKVGTMMNKADAKSLNLILGNRGETYALLTESLDNILLYETKTQELIAQESISLINAKEVFFSDDGEYLAILNQNTVVDIYDGTTLKKRTTLYETEGIDEDCVLWYEAPLQSYIMKANGRAYVLDAGLHPVADMSGLVAYNKKTGRFLRKDDVGYWYIQYLSYDRLAEMGQHLMQEYEADEDVQARYPL